MILPACGCFWSWRKSLLFLFNWFRFWQHNQNHNQNWNWNHNNNQNQEEGIDRQVRCWCFQQMKEQSFSPLSRPQSGRKTIVFSFFVVNFNWLLVIVKTIELNWLPSYHSHSSTSSLYSFSLYSFYFYYSTFGTLLSDTVFEAKIASAVRFLFSPFIRSHSVLISKRSHSVLIS